MTKLVAYIGLIYLLLRHDVAAFQQSLQIHSRSFTILHAEQSSTDQNDATGGSGRSTNNNVKDSSANPRIPFKRQQHLTLAELREKIMQNPSKYQSDIDKAKPVGKKSGSSSTYRRTRQKVANPKQSYMYAAQRKQLQQQKEEGITTTSATADSQDKDKFTQESQSLAREWGLKLTALHCDPVISDCESEQPKIMGQIQVSDESGSSTYAYIINKPAGWAIFGGNNEIKKSTKSKSNKSDNNNAFNNNVNSENDLDMYSDDISEEDILAFMTAEEQEEYLRDTYDGSDSKSLHSDSHNGSSDREQETKKSTLENLKRIQARLSSTSSNRANFADVSRPSLVAWLKQHQAETKGISIRGGNFWSALSGATAVDDSGLVLLCPKAHIANVFIDQAEFIAIVGTGGTLAKTTTNKQLREHVKVDLLSRVRKGRGDDAVHALKITTAEVPVICSDLVEACQQQLQNGVRGDPAADPLDRRARRRLMHCQTMTVSSLTHESSASIKLDFLPDDIANLADRRNNFRYSLGSFLGRSSLLNNTLTNCYREISGASDGCPGWVVDRYDKWLLVQHDPLAASQNGPLPSIHDGSTSGVYYIESNPDRNAMGNDESKRPTLLEGKRAPDSLTVVENGVKFVVSLDQDLSTGLFLDQRPQRAWLKQNCLPQTTVLNCFAHTGGYSVAAAVAGASTVNIDLSKKWLDRFPQHLQANGIEFDEKHDCIYGDCFEWLVRLAKRGEKYDIVILDPPSYSVGGQKSKRWSVAKDMDELVATSAKLVKQGGLLWTTTNNASISHVKFGKLCHKGLVDAGVKSFKLDHVQPMPCDIQSIGPSPVKNFVWKIG